VQLCGMFSRLKEKWNVSWLRFILIFSTFALGGSLCGYLGRKILGWMNLETGIGYIILYILLVTLLWPLCVLTISIPLGQFTFFRKYLRKIGMTMFGRQPKINGRRKRLAIFASGAGSNAKRIIEHFNNNASAKVVLIVCNNPTAGVLQIAADNNIPVMMINRKGFYEEEQCLQELELHQVDLIVLAGFLWIIPAYLIKAYPNRIINIHPALLPKFGGKGMYGENVHKAIIEAGEKESGITIHYVDEHYDKGDIIFQARCAVESADTPAALAQKIHVLEHEHYPRVIEKLLQ
jgi:formyltetrahydrofolate-dependent phosphoribosylglycinamide formyltransferase